ncbi:hypothetical protein EYF80_020599 [Liparis tanakae]|uniref:Uncharacterized protein n=1 Tax=Liparis tanakae TaxID=230148 RepID=A0A4Z2HW61_9TELE|nr:hypothetical protein EYF80_020599 [Liparis tanakae]
MGARRLARHVIISACLLDRVDQLICTAGVMIDGADGDTCHRCVDLDFTEANGMLTVCCGGMSLTRLIVVVYLKSTYLHQRRQA